MAVVPTNPIKIARESLGLTRRQLAAAASTSYTYLASLESGYQPRIPRSIFFALAEMGVDVTKLDARYKEWRKADVEIAK